MTARDKLPNRRYSESFDFAHMGIRYAGQVGFFPDGTIGEVFFGMEKAAGTPMDVVARDAAVLISLGLQHGLGLKEMLHSITKDENGRPEGVIGSLLTFLFEYQPKDQPADPVSALTSEKASDAGETDRELARQMGFTGNQCTTCMSLSMKVAGHCEVCINCGTTTGCS